MNLYKISQEYNNGYDTYDSLVVVAETEEDARMIHPCGKWSKEENEGISYSWVPLNKIGLIAVEYLGTTEKERGVILTSFSAG